MGNVYKKSRYNHFVKLSDDMMLAFNAVTCGLGELSMEKYDTFEAWSKNGNGGEIDESSDLFKDLRKGGFLIPDDADEIDGIRANHYMARFGNTGFGLTIIPTFRCNFNCDYCYEDRDIHSSPASKGGVMSDEVCENLLSLCEKNIKEKSTFTVTWYGGEPLMAKNTIGKLTDGILRICEAKNAEFRAGMVTNGYLLSPENLNFLVEKKVGSLQVTIDGPEEIHNMRRPLKSGGPTYQRILDNLGYVADKLPISISIRVNVDQRNQSKIRDLLLDLKSRNLHQRKNVTVYFSQTIQFANSCTSIAGECMVTQEFSSWMVEAYKIAMELGFRVTIYPATQIGTCGAVNKSSAVIEPDGYVQNCWNTVGYKSLRTGELTKDGIVYNSKYVKWLGWTPFREECRDCNVLPLCMGGCPFRNLYADELVDASKNTCVWWTYNLQPMLLVLREAQQQGLLAARRVQARKEVAGTETT